MRKNRVVEQDGCYHLVSRLAHRAFFLEDEEKDRAVALMRRVEAGVKASMSYCINRAVSIALTLLVPQSPRSRRGPLARGGNDLVYYLGMNCKTIHVFGWGMDLAVPSPLRLPFYNPVGGA